MGKKKSVCGVCGKLIGVNGKGLLVKHGGSDSQLCPGSLTRVATTSQDPGQELNAAGEICQYCGAVGEHGRYNPNGPICDSCAGNVMLDTIIEVMEATGKLSEDVKQRAEQIRRLLEGD